MRYTCRYIKVGYLIDKVSHQEAGFLADPHDHNLISYDLNLILEDADRIKKLSLQSRLKAKKDLE